MSDLGIDLSLPGPALRASLSARREEMRQQHEQLTAIQQEADRLLLPAILDLYQNGGDAERQRFRGLLGECRGFRWGFGWGLTERIATAADARKALAVLSMKDGDTDWRDQIVGLDRLCAAMERARLPVARLLREAAGWSSGVPRFPPARSTRALLLDYARRFSA